jgi:glucan phosphoethanolaminetransferase (alkaline phosphatase superfamily)
MKRLLGLLFITLLVFEFLFFENIFTQMNFLWETKNLYISGYYAFVTGIGFFSLSLMFFLQEKIYFTLFFMLLLLTYGIDLVYKQINNVGFSLNDLTLMLAEVDVFAVDALITYAEAIKVSFIILILFIIFVLVFRNVVHKKKLYLPFRWFFLSFMVALLLSYSVIYRTTGATQTRPTFFKMLNTCIFYAANKLYYGKREVLERKPTELSKYKNIILIVDESIGGKYLSINGYERETTPYLKSIEKSFANLGLASSGGNCSSKSNLILMSGIQLDALPDKENESLKEPSIFQYAKNAGYTTHYISGQSINDRLQNHMSRYDLKYIDDFIQPKSAYTNRSIPEENVVMATKKALGNADKNFIFMVKHGAHFQWEGSYPESEKTFLPTLTSSDALTLKRKEEAVNSYLNAVRYNVDLFFEKFLEEIDFAHKEETLIIYTSDHGQSILEEGRVATHCDSTNPPLSQGIVPLLLFTTKEDKLIKSFAFKKDIYSHFQLIPTIQKLMGYNELNAQTLFDVDEKNYEQTFVSGDLFGRVSLQKNTLKK